MEKQTETIQVSVDTLSHMVAFVQHWMDRAAEKQGAQTPSELFDVIADGCARNLGVDSEAFVEAVADARRTFAAQQLQSQAAAGMSAAGAQRVAGGGAATASFREGYAFADDHAEAPRPKYNPADYDEDAPISSMYANSPGFDINASGGCLEACEEDDCSSCRFANEHGYANELLAKMEQF